MKCPKCESEGLKSKLYPGSTFVTAMGTISYYDEDGNYVHHDPNIRTTGYHCSNKHKFSVSECMGENEIHWQEEKEE